MDLVLVHGAFHGAWCWQDLTPELERRGHRVVAMDLPIGDPDAGANAYAAAVEAAIDDDLGAGAKPVLVGHSMGGLVTPLVAARRPVAGLVFLAAFLPQPGRSVNDQRQAEPIDALTAPTSAEWTDLGRDVWSIGPTTAAELFYHDAAPETVSWAISRLRPQCYRAMNEAQPARGLAGRRQPLPRLPRRSGHEPGLGSTGRPGAAGRRGRRAGWRPFAVPDPTRRAGAGHRRDGPRSGLGAGMSYGGDGEVSATLRARRGRRTRDVTRDGGAAGGDRQPDRGPLRPLPLGHATSSRRSEAALPPHLLRGLLHPGWHGPRLRRRALERGGGRATSCTCQRAASTPSRTRPTHPRRCSSSSRRVHPARPTSKSWRPSSGTADS